MTDIRLSAGAITKIMEGETVNNPVFQILGHKKIKGDKGVIRYRLNISDGVHCHSFAMLATHLNDMFSQGNLENLAVFRTDKMIISDGSDTINQIKVLIILEVSILATPSKDRQTKIGSPVQWTLENANLSKAGNRGGRSSNVSSVSSSSYDVKPNGEAMKRPMPPSEPAKRSQELMPPPPGPPSNFVPIKPEVKEVRKTPKVILIGKMPSLKNKAKLATTPKTPPTNDDEEKVSTDLEKEKKKEEILSNVSNFSMLSSKIHQMSGDPSMRAVADYVGLTPILDNVQTQRVEGALNLELNLPAPSFTQPPSSLGSGELPADFQSALDIIYSKPVHQQVYSEPEVESTPVKSEDMKSDADDCTDKIELDDLRMLGIDVNDTAASSVVKK